RLLSLDFAGTTTQINIANMDTLGDLQDAIKLKYSPLLENFGAPQLQLYDQQKNQITSWSSLSALSENYFTDGGVSLTVSVFVPKPPPKRIWIVFEDEDQEIIEKSLALTERAFENSLRFRCDGLTLIKDGSVVTAFSDLIENEKYCYYPTLSGSKLYKWINHEAPAKK
ncbi:hypothetical protein HDU83_001059, partial [Entophlyctis luteolus]